MILLYTAVLFLLGTAHFLMRRRIAGLEAKHGRIARQTDQLLKEPVWKGGGSGRVDAALTAKRQYLLGQLVQKRDRLEGKHDRWLGRSEWLGKLRARLRSWQGRKLPYTFGALDVYGAMYFLDRFGFAPYLHTAQLLELVQTWLIK